MKKELRAPGKSSIALEGLINIAHPDVDGKNHSHVVPKKNSIV